MSDTQKNVVERKLIKKNVVERKLIKKNVVGKKLIKKNSKNNVERVISETYNNMRSVGYDLFPHQRLGVKWMLEREISGVSLINNSIRGGLLCDVPGLGKTIQMCATMLGNPVNKTLLIVPKSVIGQWVDAIRKIIPNSKIYIHMGIKRVKIQSELYELDFNIALTTLQSLYNNRSIFLGFGQWGRIIIDEAHYIRNIHSKLSKCVCELRGKHKWCLTGTPIQNNVKDILTLYKFLGINSSNLNIANLEKLNDNLLLRRSKSVLKDRGLKDIKYHDHVVLFETVNEREIYEKIKTNIIDNYMNIIRNNTSTQIRNIAAFELSLRLRQVSIHPQIVIDGLERKLGEKSSLKFDGSSSRINKIVNEIRKTGDELCIVFCQFTSEIDIFEKVLKEEEIGVKRYEGSMNLKQREKALDSFLSKEKKDLLSLVVEKNNISHDLEKIIVSFNPKVLLMQIKSGGVGLNLQQFQHIFISSPDWNPGNEIQAIARADRIGQSGTVNVHRFLLEDDKMEFGTIDRSIFNIQMNKLNIMKEILKEDNIAGFN